MSRIRRAVVWGSVLAVGLASERALGQERASPYSAETDRDIKALGPEEVLGLLAGAGLGFAKAAELNGIPGPRHVLDMAAELGLDDGQRSAVQAVYDVMLSQAVELGTQIVGLERRLDRLFAESLPNEAEVRSLTAEIGETRGHLRGAHLVAHLRTAKLLTPHQIASYARLRGYSEPPENAGEHTHDHSPRDGS